MIKTLTPKMHESILNALETYAQNYMVSSNIREQISTDQYVDEFISNLFGKGTERTRGYMNAYEGKKERYRRGLN